MITFVGCFQHRNCDAWLWKDGVWDVGRQSQEVSTLRTLNRCLHFYSCLLFSCGDRKHYHILLLPFYCHSEDVICGYAHISQSCLDLWWVRDEKKNKKMRKYYTFTLNQSKLILCTWCRNVEWMQGVFQHTFSLGFTYMQYETWHDTHAWEFSHLLDNDKKLFKCLFKFCLANWLLWGTFKIFFH